MGKVRVETGRGGCDRERRVCQGEEANRENKHRKGKEGKMERGDKGRKMEKDREGKGLTD